MKARFKSWERMRNDPEIKISGDDDELFAAIDDDLYISTDFDDKGLIDYQPDLGRYDFTFRSRKSENTQYFMKGHVEEFV